MLRIRRLPIGIALVATCALLAACGDDGDKGSFTEAARSDTVDTAIPKSGCGAIATPLPEDPDGVLATLPPEQKNAYAGYQRTVSESPWSDFKPDHPPPYKVGLSFAQLTNATQNGIFNAIKKTLEADPDIEFTGVTTGNQLNIPQQQQQVQTLLNDDPDLLIVEPLTDSFGALVDKAGKRGIPTISFQGTTSSKYAINVQHNSYGDAALALSSMFRRMGGEGNAMFVHGLASTTVDAEAVEAYKAGLKNCPKIKSVGEIAGAFVAPTAKAEMLKFLASHPEQVDAVYELGGMAPGVIAAFEQAGRPVPLVTDTAGMRASLGFWNEHKPDYNGFGLGFPPAQFGNSVATLAKGILAGGGLKVSEVTKWQPTITSENLDEWAKPDWSLSTPGVAEGPPGNFMSKEFLAGLFNDPSAVESVQ